MDSEMNDHIFVPSFSVRLCTLMLNSCVRFPSSNLLCLLFDDIICILIINRIIAVTKQLPLSPFSPPFSSELGSLRENEPPCGAENKTGGLTLQSTPSRRVDEGERSFFSAGACLLFGRFIVQRKEEMSCQKKTLTF